MKKRLTLSVMMLCLMISSSAFAQKLTPAEKQQKRQEVLAKFNAMSKEEIDSYHAQMYPRIPKVQKTPDMLGDAVSTLTNEALNTKSKGVTLPEDMIFPIESDEVQAIMMTWSYNTTTMNGAYASQMFEGLGTTGYGTTLVDVVSVPDVSPNSSYAKLFAELANGIQKHAQVWIDIWDGADSTIIKDFMAERGTPLTNYRFFVHPGNAFWFRDFGPIVAYYGDNDDLAFVDIEYYGGRPLDDVIPVGIANDLGWPIYTTGIEYEGGNILLDGLGSLFTTTALYSANQDSYGQAYLDTTSSTPRLRYYSKQALTKSQVDDSLRYLFNLSNLKVLPTLKYDGGTGHIDLYCDMWEESSFVVAQYPDALASASDAIKVAKNLDTLLATDNYFGEKYTAVRIPLPAKNNGAWYTSETQYNNSYTRSYSNHVFVNDAIVQPVFYDTTLSGTQAGDIEGNKRAMKFLKEAYPGYKFEEIDVRSFDGFGGAIHCITKQVPAENPVRIYHQPVRYINTTENPATSVNLSILSQNKSGIDNVKLYYHYSGETNYTELACTSMGDNMYSVDVPLQNGVANDTLFYYISSTSNNGKTITKPMTAPEGYYTMPYGTEITGVVVKNPYDTTSVSIEGLAMNTIDNISEIYPNPANAEVSVSLEGINSDVYYRIINVKGQAVKTDKIVKGTSSYTMNVENLSEGVYWVVFTNGNFSTARKLVIAR